MLIISFVFCLVALKCVVFSDDPEPIKTEDGTLKAAGPFLIDAKVKEGEAPPTSTVGKFTILQKRMTWGEALIACENVTSGQLVVLPKLEHATQLADDLYGVSSKAADIEDPANKADSTKMNLGVSRRYWIGLTDQHSEGNWTWINMGATLDYDYWYPGQPSHVGDKATNKGEHCVHLWNPGYWGDTDRHRFNDAPCTQKYYAICDGRKAEDIKKEMLPDA